MNNILLDAKVRAGNTKGYTRELRNKGFIPGVLYGKQPGAVKISLVLKELEQALAKGGTKGLVTLNLTDNNGPVKVPTMIKEMQTHPLKGVMTHIDFYQVNLKEKVVAEVLINLTGEAEGVKAGGILQQQLRVVEVECLPTEIPSNISLDISYLGIGDQVLVRDLPIPATVDLITEREKLVAGIAAPRTTEPDEAGEPVEAGEEPGDNIDREETAGGEAEAEKA
ncbi:MAG: 50S ribosomal protein L25 [Clostridia bacterium]|jgi:large subunit ribosomal protein L25|nr:50S ribosomal protein L25 [Clostridia bacterium]